MIASRSGLAEISFQRGKHWTLGHSESQALCVSMGDLGGGGGGDTLGRDEGKQESANGHLQLRTMAAAWATSTGEHDTLGHLVRHREGVGSGRVPDRCPSW